MNWSGSGRVVGYTEAPQKFDRGKGVRVTAEPKRLAFISDTCRQFLAPSDDPIGASGAIQKRFEEINGDLPEADL
jgi:hypothetical protein